MNFSYQNIDTAHSEIKDQIIQTPLISNDYINKLVTNYKYIDNLENKINVQEDDYNLHINEIKAFAKDRGRFRSVFTNGAVLKAGGLGYVGLNIINSAINGDNIFETKNIFNLIINKNNKLNYITIKMLNQS